MVNFFSSRQPRSCSSFLFLSLCCQPTDSVSLFLFIRSFLFRFCLIVFYLSSWIILSSSFTLFPCMSLPFFLSFCFSFFVSRLSFCPSVTSSLIQSFIHAFISIPSFLILLSFASLVLHSFISCFSIFFFTSCLFSSHHRKVCFSSLSFFSSASFFSKRLLQEKKRKARQSRDFSSALLVLLSLHGILWRLLSGKGRREKEERSSSNSSQNSQRRRKDAWIQQ